METPKLVKDNNYSEGPFGKSIEEVDKYQHVT